MSNTNYGAISPSALGLWSHVLYKSVLQGTQTPLGASWTVTTNTVRFTTISVCCIHLLVQLYSYSCMYRSFWSFSHVSLSDTKGFSETEQVALTEQTWSGFDVTDGCCANV